MDKDRKNGRLTAYPGPQPVGRPPESRQPTEIVFSGELSDRNTDLLPRLLDVPLKGEVVIYFDTGGGSVYSGLALATMIRVRELKATAVVVGECSSAGLLPFAACRRRLVTSLSTLLFHPIRWSSEENVHLEEAAEWARHFRQLEGDVDHLLTHLFPISAEKLHEWTRPGRFVSGTELAAAGLAELFDPFRNEKPWQTVRQARAETAPPET